MRENQIPLEVATMINIGDNTPNIKKAISTKPEVISFTSSPCLLHDCFTFIGVSSVINSYIRVSFLSLTLIFITLMLPHSQN